MSSNQEDPRRMVERTHGSKSKTNQLVRCLNFGAKQLFEERDVACRDVREETLDFTASHLTGWTPLFSSLCPPIDAPCDMVEKEAGSWKSERVWG